MVRMSRKREEEYENDILSELGRDDDENDKREERNRKGDRDTVEKDDEK